MLHFFFRWPYCKVMQRYENKQPGCGYSQCGAGKGSIAKDVWLYIMILLLFGLSLAAFSIYIYAKMRVFPESSRVSSLTHPELF